MQKKQQTLKILTGYLTAYKGGFYSRIQWYYKEKGRRTSRGFSKYLNKQGIHMCKSIFGIPNLKSDLVNPSIVSVYIPQEDSLDWIMHECLTSDILYLDALWEDYTRNLQDITKRNMKDRRSCALYVNQLLRPDEFMKLQDTIQDLQILFENVYVVVALDLPKAELHIYRYYLDCMRELSEVLILDVRKRGRIIC